MGLARGWDPCRRASVSSFFHRGIWTGTVWPWEERGHNYWQIILLFTKTASYTYFPGGQNRAIFLIFKQLDIFLGTWSLDQVIINTCVLKRKMFAFEIQQSVSVSVVGAHETSDSRLSMYVGFVSFHFDDYSKRSWRSLSKFSSLQTGPWFPQGLDENES